VGLKPTYGRVSRYGLIAFASSLDQVGVFGASVRDVALTLQVIAGWDPHDATSAQLEPFDPDIPTRGLSGVRVGVPAEYFADGIEPGVEARVREAIALLGQRGATLVPLSMPSTRYAVATYYLIATAEASSNLARFDGVRFGARVEASDFHAMRAATRAAFGPAVRDRLAYGERITRNAAEYGTYARARATRARVTDELRSALQGVDVLLTPATPGAAFRIADAESSAGHDSDVFLLAANFAGIPALSVPFGESSNLPLGMHLMAPWWQEHALVRVAGALERAAAR
jgi:aspartyl-tRNA(Asn)/glutamyl-tRNA(Gln) amidotransferase subunit A